MKKIFFPGVLLALMFVFSCTKDQYTEEQAQQAQTDLISYQDSIDQVRDSLNKIGGIIQYSVSVIPVDGGTGFVNKSVEKIKGLAGATVTVSQHGVLLTDTTDESGIAVFNDLRVGTFNVNVRSEGYTTVNFISEVKPEGTINVNVYYDVLRTAATMVPVFNITEEASTATIKGKITYEADLTNKVQEVASDVSVVARIDVDALTFRTEYLEPLGVATTFGAYHAAIVQIAYSELVVTDVTDEDGLYEIAMPSSADGLPVKIEVSDVVVDQKLLLRNLLGFETFGVQTVRTIFSSNYTPTGMHDSLQIPAAYATFSTPTGGVLVQKPIKEAKADAVIGESGIASIIITNQGDGYTQAPIVQITTTTGFGEGAKAVAYISDGKVTSIEITDPGRGYEKGDVTVSFDDKVGTDALATPVMSYSITSYTVLTADQGDGYQSVPDVIVTSPTGSGASAKAIMSGYVSDIKVSAMGSGYVSTPNVVIEGSAGTDASAFAVMTVYNPIHSILLGSAWKISAANYFRTAPVVTIESISKGSGATAIAVLETTGGIATDGIEITNAGAGYLEAPTVLITGGSGTGAVAYSTLNSDGTINIVVVATGSGYTATNPPTVQISAPPAGGTQATANIFVSFPIKEIVVTNPGAGYDIAYVAAPGAGSDNYNVEPKVFLNKQTGKPGELTGDVDVIVRPDMKLELVTFTGGNRGDSYEKVPAVTILSKEGLGSGATAVAEMMMKVKKLDVVTEGSGYSFDAAVNVTIVNPATGVIAQAKATANKGKGKLSSIVIDNSGDSYLAPPKVKLVVAVASNNASNDADPIIEALLTDGKITGFTIVNSGENFKWISGASGDFTITIRTFESGVTAAATAKETSGKISFIAISEPGEGYASIPLVRFVRLDGPLATSNPIYNTAFTDAEATAVIEDGRVVAINITNPGTGYYYKPRIEIYIPDGLAIAKYKVVVNAVDGYVTGFTQVQAGAGYAEAPTVTILSSVPGIGSGATATAVVEGGQVKSIKLTNAGSGYFAKNNPSKSKSPVFLPAAVTSVVGGKTYVQDIYLGTGLRTITY